MDPIKVIEVKQDVLGQNDKRAEEVRRQLKADGTFLLNVMSSPGSGKTTTLLGTAKRLAPDVHMAVMEADIDSTVDAATMAEAGIDTIQVHTGGMCHLDAAMTLQGLEEVGYKNYDLVVLENVGNLVCPAEFDTGASKNVAILSVPEGDDKPLKYPLMFEVANCVLINKIDAASLFDFDLAIAEKNIHMRNPDAKVFPISAKTGEGMDAWVRWLTTEMKTWKEDSHE